MPIFLRLLKFARGLRACRGAAAAIVAIAIMVFQQGCFFRKGKVEEPQVRTPVRIVLLPLNLSSDQSDLRWLSTAIPVLMAEAIRNSPDLEIVPLWESLPIAVEALGSSRTLTTETAAYVASRLSARWATQGEVGQGEPGVSVLIDFIPSKATVVAFRYEKKGELQSVGNYVRESVEQFLRYLAARPLDENVRVPDPASVRQVAEAIDREYGWFVPAEPGKSDQVVSGLVQTDKQLAGLLFNPNLYPAVGTRPGNKPQPEKAPQPAPVGVQPPPPPAAAPKVPEPESSAAPPAPAVQEEDFALPPPKSFTQTIESSRARADRPAAPPGRSASVGEGPSPAPKQPGPPRQSVEKNKSSPAPAASPAAGIRIQVLSSRNRHEAEAMAVLLRRRGLEPTVEEVDLEDKGIWYRIRLHGYASRDAAVEAAQKLVADGLIKEFWILP